jgi:hypothetical protein
MPIASHPYSGCTLTGTLDSDLAKHASEQLRAYITHAYFSAQVAHPQVHKQGFAQDQADIPRHPRKLESGPRSLLGSSDPCFASAPASKPLAFRIQVTSFPY